MTSPCWEQQASEAQLRAWIACSASRPARCITGLNLGRKGTRLLDYCLAALALLLVADGTKNKSPTSWARGVEFPGRGHTAGWELLGLVAVESSWFAAAQGDVQAAVILGWDTLAVGPMVRKHSKRLTSRKLCSLHHCQQQMKPEP